MLLNSVPSTFSISWTIVGWSAGYKP